MIRGATIVCLASGYDAPPTSKQHVMHVLAEHNVVLWVNYHASRRPGASASDFRRILHKLSQAAGGLRQARPGLYVLTPLAVPLPASRWARRFNRRLLAWQIGRAVAKTGRGDVHVWSFTPDIEYLLDDLRPRTVLYYCVDDFSQFTGYDRDQVLADEARLARRADLVVTTSQTLQQAKRPLNPRTILVPHGVDHRHFSRALDATLAVPDDLEAIPRPRLGFFGLIRDWVDLNLLAEAAMQRPAWHFVLLGDSTVDLAPYRSLPNMHFPGPRPYAQLPAYCKGFDIALVPFVVNALTQAVNPIKMREYLAAGLPVISTPMPEADKMQPLVRIATSARDLVLAAEQLLAEDNPRQRAARSQSVREMTWPAKVELICRELGFGG